ncbi:MAG: TetR/AcrR family transcriptional regulator [Actinobacteria bacterium]|nr:TetR/AcrR family transcriptional regulator [Actinomycetota bacterium]
MQPATAVHHEKSRRILRAAIAVFARNGYHASKVGDVATEAGVAYGLVYHYFGSKEQLLETIFRRTWRNMLEQVEEVERSEAPLREQIRAIARIVLGGWQVDPELIRVLIREVARGPQLQHEVDEIQLAFAALERVLTRGQERGQLRAELEPRLAAWILYGALEEILTGWVFGSLAATDEDVARAEESVVAVLSDGLCT